MNVQHNINVYIFNDHAYQCSEKNNKQRSFQDSTALTLNVYCNYFCMYKWKYRVNTLLLSYKLFVFSNFRVML